MEGLMRAALALAAALAAGAVPGTKAAAATAGPALPGLTAAEMTAYDLWSLRAGLNVAAIQCQFSGFLRTVPTYNGLLGQHSREFTAANAAMDRYFVRTKGARSAKLEHDRFNTRLWQSFSSIDAQLPFCDAAAEVGREVLATPVGKLAERAGPLLGRIRAAFGPPASSSLGGMTGISVPVMGFAVADVPPCRNPRRGRC
jgi:hypothetical protein